MQSYSYSVFSIVAIAIHLIINADMLIGRRGNSELGSRYRSFLMGILAYYIADASWGILAGLGWNRCLYAETVFFFLSLVVFALMWSRFVVVYLGFGKWVSRILVWFGYALLAFNLAALAVNPFNRCFYYLDNGVYRTGFMRDPAFYLLVAYNLLIAVFVLAKALGCREAVRRRGMMVFMFCVTMAAADMLQVLWPLTPFTSLGCLVGNCFLHVFVVADEQNAKHTATLENALERAHAAEKARSLFFSIVSHDIRTPLNAILGYSELLQFGIKSQAERDEALQSIRASGTTLLQLVNDVLDLAKMDSDKMTLHPEPTRLGQLTDDVFASFRLAASEKGISLVNRTAEVPTLLLDEHRFRQILFNLIGNAVKFTAQGSVTVAAAYADAILEVSVADTGCGIPPNMLTRILDPFVQVQDPSHTADRLGGIGLGLSICKRLVELMGGKLIVESELGKGSTFRIRIPKIAVAEDHAGSAAGQGDPAKSKKLPQHVLIVDDSPVNRKVLSAFLKRAGIAAIDCACNGAEALVALDSAAKTDRPYDFILSDLWMPNMNGLEFIVRLRADPRFEHLSVYALTADSEFHRDVRTELFTGVLLKPVTYDKLTEVFETAS